MKNIPLLQAQIAQTHGFILLYHAKIVSGDYKNSKTQQAYGYSTEKGMLFRDMTDDEKLTDHLNTLHQHQENLTKLVSVLGASDDTGSKR